MPIREDLPEDERAIAELMVTIGQLARFFKTPIPFFLGLDQYDLTLWIEVMDEIIRRENKESERAMQAAQRR